MAINIVIYPKITKKCQNLLTFNFDFAMLVLDLTKEVSYGRLENRRVTA